MKFLVGLIITIVLFYFGMDSYLGFQLKAKTPNSAGEEKALVQNMAKFLETSPQIQQKIQDSGHQVNPSIRLTSTPQSQSIESGEIDRISKFFGNTPTDEFYKGYLVRRKATDLNDADAQAKLLIEFSEYMTKHPQESIECLETALQSIPMDLKAEREAIIPAFIHSAVYYIENVATDEEKKRSYLNRFMNTHSDPLIKGALESHFEELLTGEVK